MSIDEAKDLDNSAHARRIVQALADLRRGDLNNATVLDLGSAHGLYTIEAALRGAKALGVEGRSAWVQQANAARDALSLSGARFVVGDVRELSKDSHGAFDICLCLGLLYHLQAQQAYDLLKNLYNMAKEFVVIDTQFALSPQQTIEINGDTYHGCSFPEHAPDASKEEMEASMGAALDGTSSFWFTLPSLINMLGNIGYSTVMQLQWPVDYLLAKGEPKFHEDYVTIIAMTGTRIADVYGTQQLPMIARPEHLDGRVLERSWLSAGWSNKKGNKPEDDQADIRTRSLSQRFSSAAKAFLS